MYKLTVKEPGMMERVIRIQDNASIPLDPANTDYQQFKTDVLAGAELQDADGVKLTAKKAKAFIATLP